MYATIMEGMLGMFLNPPEIGVYEDARSAWRAIQNRGVGAYGVYELTGLPSFRERRG